MPYRPPVAGAATDVICRRPPINMGMADVVRPTALPQPAVAGAPAQALPAPAARAAVATPPAVPASPKPSAMGRVAGFAAPAAALAGVAGAVQSFDDVSSGRRDQFQRDLGVTSPLGSVGADAARVLSNVGDAATFGLAGRTGRGVASALGGGSFVDGFAGPRDGAAPPAADVPLSAPIVAPVAVAAAPATAVAASRDARTVLAQPAPPPQTAGGISGTVTGETSADRVAQLQRDGQHLKDLTAIQRRIDAEAGPTPGLAAIDGAGADAERRGRFN